MSELKEDIKGATGFTGASGDLDWWQQGAIYQIYPRSFQDSNGDGVGDLRGILGRIDYLACLGIKAVWLSPFFTSPMVDHGYDISNFIDVDPVFGCLQDFDDLISALHDRGLKMILDFVPNHTSDQHPWFTESCKCKTNLFSDFYVWSDGKIDADGTKYPPNNWISKFGGPAWHWVEERQQWYFHHYTKEQPDLNWRNPQVVKHMNRVLEFWLNRGVDGFRVDAIAALFECEDLSQDEPRSGNPNATPDMHPYLLHIHTKHQPETYEAVKQWRLFLDQYEARTGRSHIYLVVELYDWTMKHSIKYYDFGVDYPFNFNLCSVERNTSGVDIYNLVNSWLSLMPAGKWPNWVIGNHDRLRISGKKGPDFTDAFNLLLLLLPGTPTCYQGDEIGQLNVEVSFEQTQDPWAKHFGEDRYKEFSRDPARAPMQWSGEQNAGFTSADHAWLPVHADYKHHNVQVQETDQFSHLSLFKKAVKLRQKDTFQSGSLRYCVVNDNVFSFVRLLEGYDSYLVAMNFGCTRSEDDYSITIGERQWSRGAVVLHSKHTTSDKIVSLKQLTLEPGQAVVLKLMD